MASKKTQTTTSAPAPLPADHPAHENLNLFLRLLLALAPAAASPFIKSDGAKAVFNAELPIVQALGAALTKQK